jgi:hypothetical protein
LAISAVWPLPEMPMDALGLGMALGAAMGYAGLRRRGAEGSRSEDNSAPAPTATPDPPLDARVGAVASP